MAKENERNNRNEIMKSVSNGGAKEIWRQWQ
jgi:hypothetical protein